MSLINTLGNFGYYQLNGGSSSQSGNAGGGNSVTQALVNALNNNNSTDGNNSDAYLLNLSPAAQQYLQTGKLPASLNGSGNAQQGFTLTDKQRQAITDILAKYKDAPYTQDTFNQIQDDLNAAGLGTTTLTMLDKAKNFNAAQVLITALNGGNPNDDHSGTPSDADEQAKARNYIQGIISQWKTISGASGSSPSQGDTADTADSQTGVTPVAATGQA